MKSKTALILVVVIIVVLMGGFFLGIGAYLSNLGGNLAKSTGALGNIGKGCYVGDAYFTDLWAVDHADEVVEKLTQKWPTAKPNEAKVREVIARGKQEGINPLIPLSIWLGEQTFRNPDEAFGVGNTGRGTNTVKGWDNELSGVYDKVRRAIDNVAPYNTPTGTNRFTRLFWHYTEAMQYVYDHAGNTWDEEGIWTDDEGKQSKPVKIRLSVFRLIAPNQIECQSQTVLAGVSGSGASTCPGVIPKYLTRKSAQQGGAGVPRVIILHYLAYGGSTSTYLTVDQAWRFFNGGQLYVQFVISREGGIYQFSPENRESAGALDYNDPRRDYGSGSIAISIENEGQFESSRKELQETPAQVEANITLVKCLMEKYNIALENVSIENSNPKSKEFLNVISHKEADARGGADGGKRGSRKSDPGERFMGKVIKGLK